MLFVFLRQMLFLKVPIGNVTVFDAVVIGDLFTIDEGTGYVRRWLPIYYLVVFHSS